MTPFRSIVVAITILTALQCVDSSHFESWNYRRMKTLCFVPTVCRKDIKGRFREAKRLSAVEESTTHDFKNVKVHNGRNSDPFRHFKIWNDHSNTIICAALICAVCRMHPSPCFASESQMRITLPTDGLRLLLFGSLDKLNKSGTKGMLGYTAFFLLWTMTVGVTTPVETAAGMAFPLSKAIPLSAIGKIGGAVLQYSLAKYFFRNWARKKMSNNKWMHKIDSSFQCNPFRVALIWRFSPLPEFVKNVGPALVPTLKTRHQILASLVHGLPFTVLWSGLGNEAAIVARGGQGSLFWKQMVAVISWTGLVFSPTLFGWWIKSVVNDDKDIRD